MKITQIQANRAALEALGEKKVPGTTKRYETWSRSRRPVKASGEFFYLGKAGAVRAGDTVKGSHPVSLSRVLTKWILEYLDQQAVTQAQILFNALNKLVLARCDRAAEFMNALERSLGREKIALLRDGLEVVE